MARPAHDLAAQDLERAAARREKLARVVLALLVVGAPIVFGVRLLTDPPTPWPQQRNPAYAHVVVLTVDRWNRPEAFPDQPAFRALAQRGVFGKSVFTTTDDVFGAAASLWTGRFAPNHGVRGVEVGLPPGSWTLAHAARHAGATTAAVLGLPFATTTRIGGFDAVVEEPGLGPDRAAELADAFLRAEPGRRKLLWVHLRDPGPGGAAADRLLGSLLATLEDSNQLVDALVMFTALSGPPRAEAEFQLRVPLLTRLPAALNAGREGVFHFSQADLVGGFLEVLRWPEPDVEGGEARLQSRTENVETALKGQDVFDIVWCEGEFGRVLRKQGLRVHQPPGVADDDAAGYELGVLLGPRQPGAALEPLPESERYEALRQFEKARSGVEARREPPVPSALPPGWGGGAPDDGAEDDSGDE